MTQLVTADKEPPAFDAGFPLVDDVTLTSFSVQVSLGEVGKVYLLVVLQGAAAPTKDDILQQVSTYRGVAVVNKAVITAPVAGTTYQATLTVPPNDAAYDVYLVTEDDGDPNTRNEAGWTGPVTYAETSQTAGIFNVLPVPVKITTENMDALAPVWTGTAYTPTVVHIAGTSLDLVAQLDEPGYVHYILLPAGSNMPTSEEVRDATYAFAPIAACGVMDVDVASTNTSIAIEGETDRDKPDCDAEFYGLLAGLELPLPELAERALVGVARERRLLLPLLPPRVLQVRREARVARDEALARGARAAPRTPRTRATRGRRAPTPSTARRRRGTRRGSRPSPP